MKKVKSLKLKSEVEAFLKEYTTEDANEVPEINVADIQKGWC